MILTGRHQITPKVKTEYIGTTQRCYIRYLYAEKAEVDAKMAEVLSEKISNITSVIDGVCNK